MQYEAWAAGTGGLLLRTFDGGETWMRDLLRKDFSTDLYRIRSGISCWKRCLFPLDFKRFVCMGNDVAPHCAGLWTTGKGS